MSYRSVFRPALFEDRVVVVTGGGSGIGRCIAHELASLGAAVAIVGRTLEKLERVAGELREQGATVSSHVCDIRDEALGARHACRRFSKRMATSTASSTTLAASSRRRWR